MEESSLGALPGPLRLFGVEEQLAVDDVADAPLEGPERFLFVLPSSTLRSKNGRPGECG